MPPTTSGSADSGLTSSQEGLVSKKRRRDEDDSDDSDSDESDTDMATFRDYCTVFEQTSSPPRDFDGVDKSRSPPVYRLRIYCDEVLLLKNGLGKYKTSPETERRQNTASYQSAVVESAHTPTKASKTSLGANLQADNQPNQDEEPAKDQEAKPKVVRFASVEMPEEERNEGLDEAK
ncbi:hypothetical protein PV10_07647 [Exophiala mesophila]|uniref:Uncharacterized protein n=1 Tax=Exophiala mesophila TaxID=212818 RepID=A0A0D1WMT6_EXOME|nr:uncharacterized protein PV10_07647 [Exophiala mesophila]KIV90335.1 hypothetical protein PV10_07647 [Exophiala mesophila]